MISFEEVVISLQQGSEIIEIPALVDFKGLHTWLKDKGHLVRNEAVVIILSGASYILYADYPGTTLIVRTEGTANSKEFGFIGKVHFHGEYRSPYSFANFMGEVIKESWLGLIIVSLLAIAAVVLAGENLGLLIDKSIDVAAIAAAFLTLFLSFKNEPRKADDLWFRLGLYRKHFRIDRYSLILMGVSLISLLLLILLSETLAKLRWGTLLLVGLLGFGWSTLYAGFRLVITFHVDRLESEGEKELADRVRARAAHNLDSSSHNAPRRER
ncbi:MAG TPA: hypothetical protein VEC99_11670 [Clostridia bacterium]|nr:hypothetical protein [Clostridia bacterium]